VGLFWGIGHSISLLLVGLLVIVLDVEIPHEVGVAMEFFVALMLAGLGLNVLVKIMRGARFHWHVHMHGGHIHTHPHTHEHESPASAFHHHEPAGVVSPLARFRNSRRPVFIGMAHGLSGSATLMLMLLATISSPGLALAYVTVFGLGSIGGMMAMSALIGIPFSLASAQSRYYTLVRGASGILSVGFGIFYAWQLATVTGTVF
jgi:hypothetical protein